MERVAFLVERTGQRTGCMLNPEGLTLRRSAGVLPRLVHFAGNLKPWRYRGRSRWHELYYAEVDRTDWRSWRPEPSPGGWLSSYGASPLRRGLRPIERGYMAFTRWRTLRTAGASDLGGPIERGDVRMLAGN